MALRDFTDERGRRWNVWDFYPQLGDGHRSEAASIGDSLAERRHAEAKATPWSDLAAGWLAFEADDGERRRLAPVPELPNGWASAAVRDLRAWCKAARRVTSGRRLVE